MMKEFKDRYIEARRELVRADFDTLNPMQQEAVLTTEGALLILAGAGSGKTTVLINRIANLIRFGRASDSDELPDDANEKQIEIMRAGGEQAHSVAALDPVEPWRILAITFTNKAADEIKARLEKKLGEQALDIWASTFHSACVRILRRDAQRLGYSSSFSIYDSADSLSLLKRICKDIELDEKIITPKSLMSEISRAKDSGISAKEYALNAELTGDWRGKIIGRVYEEYAGRCFSANAMDFDDLIFNTVRLLNENEDVCDYWQRRFKYVLIDEYQDTNLLQYRLAELLSGGWGNICVVGDDDQSIYKFRGATIENILSFEKQFSNCRTIRLEQNYRSTANILEAANAVIRNNSKRKGKELWTDKDRGKPIELNVAEDGNEEAENIASILMRSFAKGIAWKDNAVLYRMNAQSNSLEYAFKRSGIPYRIIGGMRFFDRAEVKDMLAYMSVLASPSDDLRLTRIINNPPRAIGAKTVEKVSELARVNACSMFDILASADVYPELQRSAIKLRQFRNMICELKDASEKLPLDELYDLLLEKTGYLRALQEKNTVEDTARAENVQELKSSIIGHMKETGDSTLEGYLSEVALYSDMDKQDENEDCVVMMTMHSAKGLEFPYVFIVGMEETIFPGTRAIGNAEEMEEERRLCYVAMTRAKQQLYMSCAKSRLIFGHTNSNRVSRFVSEIPEENIKKNIPKKYEYTNERHERPSSRYSELAPRHSSAPTVIPEIEVGDKLKHKAFGRGVLLKKQPMGGDYLLEIAFETEGTRKFMLRSAAMSISKDEE